MIAMAIYNSDIKLFDSQRQDGGGQLTGNVVINDNINNLFQDIPGSTTVGDLRKLRAGLSLCKYLYLSLKRQLLCIMKDLTLIF